MKRADIDGITLEYEVQGTGDPVVLIHGAWIADTFPTLMNEPVLRDRFRLIRYRRRGYGGSSRADGQLPVSRHAADCLALMRSLDAEPAHVVGHSYGCDVALRLALDAPEAVRSLSLLEALLFDVPSAPKLVDELERAAQMCEAGEKAAAVDSGLRSVCGQEYRAALDAAVLRGFEQAVSDADTLFGAELPALGEWTFTRGDAARIKQPVLSVLGANSDAVVAAPVWGESHERLLEWLPQAKPFVLPRATHLLHVQNPRDMAQALAGFFAEN